MGGGALVVTVATTAAATLPGPHAPAGQRLVLLALALVGWVSTLVATARLRTLGRTVILTAAVAGTALALVAPPVGSTDVSSYAVYGRMVSAHHASPYRGLPADFPNDPWYPRMATFWHHTGSVYGPVFTAVSAAGMAWAGPSQLKGRLFFQLLAALSFLACLVLVDRKTRGDPAALVLIGLNPVLVAGVVNGGHNDVMLGLAVLAGVVLAMEERPRWAAAGFVIGLGVLVKLVGLLALAALAAWAWRRFGRRAAVTVAAAGGATTVVGYLLAGGAAALRPVLHATGQQQLPGVWAYPRRWLTHSYGALTAEHTAGRLALATIGVLAVIVVVSRLDARSPVLPVAGSLFAFLVAAAYLMAWYPAWVLPLLALRWRSRLGALIAAHAGVLMLAAVERPSQLSGPTLDVVRFLHDTFLPAAEVLVIVLLAAEGIRRYAMSAFNRSSTAPSASTRTSSSVRS
jgi:hypothetical protein